MISYNQEPYILTIYGFAIVSGHGKLDIAFPIVYNIDREYLSIVEEATIYDLMFTHRVNRVLFLFDEEIHDDPNFTEVVSGEGLVHELGINKISHRGNDGITPISERLLINDRPIVVRPHPSYPDIMSLDNFIKVFEYFINFIYMEGKFNSHAYSYVKEDLGAFKIYRYRSPMIEVIDDISRKIYHGDIPHHVKSIMYKPSGKKVKDREKTYYRRRLNNLDYEFEEDYKLTNDLTLPVPVMNPNYFSGKEFLSTIAHEVRDICKDLSMYKYNDLLIVASEMGILDERKKLSKKELCNLIKKHLMIQNENINTIFEGRSVDKLLGFLTTDDLLTLDHLGKITI